MKIVTWNINKAAYVRKGLWDFIKQMNFDIGFFQEVYIIPYELRDKFFVIRGEMNAILINKNSDVKIKSKDVLKINSMNDVIRDFLLSCEVEFIEKNIILINIYNYMGTDEKAFSEFLEILYSFISRNQDKLFIFGGDFNINSNFQGHFSAWGELAKNMIKKLSVLGYIDVLSRNLNNESITFVTPNKKASYQLDYLFIPNYVKVINVMTGNKNQIFNQKPRLSDHLPIIAEIEF